VQGVYDSMVHYFFPPDPNVKITLDYDPSFGMELDINPKIDNLIKPEIFQANLIFIPLFCTIKYRYQYDATVPILVTIFDPISDSISIKEDGKYEVDGTGFKFQFPLDIYICKNQKRECIEGIITPSINLDDLDLDLGDNLCDPNNFVKNISLNVTYKNKPAEGVNVIYRCGSSLNQCFIGKTNKNGELNGSFPRCVDNGVVLFDSKNYTSPDYSLNVDRNTPSKLRFSVEEKIILKPEIYISHLPTFMLNHYNSNGFTNSWCGKSPNQLFEETLILVDDRNNERVLVSLKTNADFGNVFVSFDDDFNSNKMRNISLRSGDYVISQQYSANTIIKPSTYNNNGDSITISFNRDSNFLDYVGMFQFGSTTLNYSIDASEIDGKEKIKFFVPVEYFRNEDLEVKDFDDENVYIRSDGFRGRVLNDTSCNGTGNLVNYNIPQNQVDQIFRPILE
jgi:hypothetical protein